jgi:uncharacterized flavoprotein (TIGR03862 family)
MLRLSPCASDVQAWAQGLGVETFVGSSGRIFPKGMKAAPLLRAWVQHLRNAGVCFHMRHRWLGWAVPAQEYVAASALPETSGTAHSTPSWATVEKAVEKAVEIAAKKVADNVVDNAADNVEKPRRSSRQLEFSSPTGKVLVHADAVVLALGGGSWSRLGSDGAWMRILQKLGVQLVPLQPSNCGFDVGWSAYFVEKFAGQPFKTVAITVPALDGLAPRFQKQGEFVATSTGLEGSLVYAASGYLRDDITTNGNATLYIDLLPDRTAVQVLAEVRHPRGSRSLVNHLKSRLKLDGIKVALLYEILGKDAMNDEAKLSAAIKALPITLKAARPIDEAISSAGGVVFEAMSDSLMLLPTGNDLPLGVFCAGEMLDWEAPTGGYLLTACLSSGFVAGQAAGQYLSSQ